VRRYFLIGGLVQRVTQAANFNGLSAAANAAAPEKQQPLLTLRMCVPACTSERADARVHVPVPALPLPAPCGASS
jgi:hypothetical protein